MADLGGIVSLALGRGVRPSVVDTGGAFEIRELSGQMRRIVLSGRALPYRPFELETTQRVNLTWLPGYAVATATILGAAEEPTQINGFWKERFIGTIPGEPAQSSPLSGARSLLVSASGSLNGGYGGNGGTEAAPIIVDGKPVSTVQEAVELFDDVVRQGQLLEVSWTTQVRHGHIRSFKKRWHNTKDCEWDMSLEWISRGEPTSAAVHALDVTAQDTRSILEAALDDAVAIMQELPAIAAELSDLVTSQLQKIFDLTQQVADAVDATADAALLPVNTTQRIVGLLGSIEGVCKDTAASIESKPAIAWHRLAQSAGRVGSTTTVAQARAEGLELGYSGPARLTPTQRMQGYSFAAEMKLSLRRIRNTAVERRVQLARQMRSELAGVYTARDGDDLRDVSFYFYGVPTEWRRIMLFNGLTSGALRAGQVVRVPRISPDGASGQVA